MIAAWNKVHRLRQFTAVDERGPLPYNNWEKDFYRLALIVWFGSIAASLSTDGYQREGFVPSIACNASCVWVQCAPAIHNEQVLVMSVM